jgi:hypothetical protein
MGWWLFFLHLFGVISAGQAWFIYLIYLFGYKYKHCDTCDKDIG